MGSLSASVLGLPIAYYLHRRCSLAGQNADIKTWGNVLAWTARYPEVLSQLDALVKPIPGPAWEECEIRQALLRCLSFLRGEEASQGIAELLELYSGPSQTYAAKVRAAQ